MAMDPWRAWSSAGASGVAMASCNSPTDPGGGTEMLRQNGIDIMGYIYIYGNVEMGYNTPMILIYSNHIYIYFPYNQETDLEVTKREVSRISNQHFFQNGLVYEWWIRQFIANIYI